MGSAIFLALHYGKVGSPVPRSMLRRPGVLVLAILAVVTAGVMSGLVAAAFGPPSQPVPAGQPQIVDGQNVLNNHGHLEPVSREVYLHVLEADQRLFVVYAGVGYLAAACVVGATGERVLARQRRPRPAD
jgi:hypothetical protein